MICPVHAMQSAQTAVTKTRVANKYSFVYNQPVKFYLIVASDKFKLTTEQESKLKSSGELIIIHHKGKLSQLPQLKEEKDEKVIGVDPDVFDWDLDAESLDNILNVKAVCAQSTSFDWIKPDELKKRKIIALNCAHFSTDAVAEYVVAMTIEGLRKTALHIKNNWKVDWNSNPLLLRGKTVGIVGLGTIGKRIAENLKGVGANVIYWSKNSRDGKFKYVSLEELFRASDVVIPAMSENDETKKIITRKLLDSMKKTALIVGINRVKNLLNKEYILDKVAKGKLGGYSFEGDDSEELHSYKGNVWAMPPIAWYTDKSLENLLDIWVDNMASVAQGKLQNVVN